MGCGASTPKSSGSSQQDGDRPSPPSNLDAAIPNPSNSKEVGRAVSAPAHIVKPTKRVVEQKPVSEPVRRLSREESDGNGQEEDLARTISDNTRLKIFSALDKDGSGVLEPWELEPWLLSNTVNRLLFGTLDADGSNTLDGDELMRGIWNLGSDKLDEDSICKLVREVDVNGDGEVALDEFLELVKTPPGPTDESKPHLVLNFDVNQTILIMDSVSGSDMRTMLNEVIANAAWGRVLESEGDTIPRWELVSSKPELKSPEVGLKTYYQFVLQDLEAKDWRAMVRGFTLPNAPGNSLSHFVDELETALSIPPAVAEAAGSELLASLGLEAGRWALLPSFLHCMRSLKRTGRSFSVCFRTFGTDLCRIVREWNALCENRHPFFIGQEAVVLDGSDGAPDYRISLSPGSKSCGTWLRNNEQMSLVLGSIEQPPIDETVDSSSIRAFYEEKQEEPIELLPTTEVARGYLQEKLSTPGQGCALALRDYYPAWSHVGRQASGGKPFFVDPKDVNVLQIFVDDHVLSCDAKIIDARCSFSKYSHQMPIGAIFGVHLIRAEPLKSIVDKEYFSEAFAAAEAAWRTACHRRRALAEAVALFAAAMATGTPLNFLRKNEVTLRRYEPWAVCPEVMLASDVSILEDGE
eukprot:CAMPEP_0178373958 /NCGR_PEP_ID=MMETSP0689_2-20121128/2131_1 /TAXON_ID=160604 /ORGANISM="Amphidinium massartii, Strain CS-259" /LENGTH=636 /DNA_ID=CAMNT_0019993917 /DNA_START=49 /DNA_END=1956 /DNA_ORIENTATION=+